MKGIYLYKLLLKSIIPDIRQYSFFDNRVFDTSVLSMFPTLDVRPDQLLAI